MTFREIRNALVERLWNYMGCPIVLADQVQPEAQLPYGIYSVSTPYAPDRGMGDYTTREAEGGNAEITRMEMPSATFSFTFCSQNRTDADGIYIYGSDEAEDLADKAIGYFQHVGYDDFLMLGITMSKLARRRTAAPLSSTRPPAGWASTSASDTPGKTLVSFRALKRHLSQKRSEAHEQRHPGIYRHRREGKAG